MAATRTLNPRRARGAFAVEFALVLGVAILLLFGGFDVCRLLWTKISVAQMAREGSRYASVRGSSTATPAQTASATTTYVQSIAAGLPNPQITISWTQAGGGDRNAPGDLVSVRISQAFNWHFAPLADTILVSESSRIITY